MPCDDVCSRAKTNGSPGAKNRAAREICAAQRSTNPCDKKEFLLRDFRGFFAIFYVSFTEQHIGAKDRVDGL